LQNLPGILFLFIGGGRGFEALRQRVAERRLDTLFRFLPYQERDRLKHSLPAADVHWLSLRPELEGLIVPSKFYGIAAAGRPTIAITAADGEIARLVERYRCGVVIEPGDAARLADTLRHFYASRAELDEMGRRGRRMLEDEFTRRQAFSRWHELLAELD
jgi:colanic acid biosynthesis glycosyl transferase WcaI